MSFYVVFFAYFARMNPLFSQALLLTQVAILTPFMENIALI
jgi:hypothetical protein